jgi:predicted nucleic acid-binding protein
MLPSVYIETSIIGYLTARSRDQVIYAARQELTRLWWEGCRDRYDLVTSELTLEESSRGDTEAAAERLQVLEGISVLDISEPRIGLIANELLEKALLPEKARADAIHLATATVHQVNYLLTWNCRHIANADLLPRVYQLLTNLGYTPPLVVTPEEFSNYE